MCNKQLKSSLESYLDLTGSDLEIELTWYTCIFRTENYAINGQLKSEIHNNENGAPVSGVQITASACNKGKTEIQILKSILLVNSLSQ